MSSGEVVFAVGPGSGLAVEGAGFEAAVQDTDEPVSDFTRGRVVPDAAGAFGVVEGAGSRRGVQSGGGLPDRRPQRTRSHHPGELDWLTQSRFSDLYSNSFRWGGWGSNPRPADYEKSGPALRVR
jgi:hypothetical protein